MADIYILQPGDNFGTSRELINANFSELLGRVELIINGMDWQESVISIEELSSALPVNGNRYIAVQSDTSTNHTWVKDSIYEWSSAADNWIETPYDEGMATFVEDQDNVYVYIGTTWLTLSSFNDHSAVSGLQGGVAYYHFTQNEYDRLTNNQDAQPLHYHNIESVLTNIVDDSVGIKQEWKFIDGYIHRCVDTNVWVRNPVETVFP